LGNPSARRLQAGLSWSIILKRREAFRQAFRGFDPVVVSQLTENDVESMLENPGIIRSKAKILATIGNAKAYLKMQSEGEDFSQLFGILSMESQ
jgi:DNA-3-methyladenine glycosylase I